MEAAAALENNPEARQVHTIARGVDSLSEFVAEVWGDQKMRDFLAGVKTDRRAPNAFVRAVRSLVKLFTGRRNVAEDSLLAAALGNTLQLSQVRSEEQARTLMRTDAVRQNQWVQENYGMSLGELSLSDPVLFQEATARYRELTPVPQHKHRTKRTRNCLNTMENSPMQESTKSPAGEPSLDDFEREMDEDIRRQWAMKGHPPEGPTFQKKSAEEIARRTKKLREHGLRL